MEYRISDMQLNRIKRKGYFMIAMALILGVSMFYVVSSVFLRAIIFIVLTGALVPMLWLIFRIELPWEQKHRLKVEEESLIYLNDGTASRLKFSAIQSVTVEWEGEEIRCITIDRGKGMTEEMPKYEDIDLLVSEMEEKLPPEKISNNKKAHFKIRL